MNRKAIFDAVRRMLHRGFTQREVAVLDAAIDEALSPCTPVLPCRIGPKGLALIKSFEGCAHVRPDGLVQAYPDPGTGAEPWTIGWGATGKGITQHSVWTQEDCDNRLAADLERYAAEVAHTLDGAPRSQPQFDALVSFHYNTGAIGRATLTRRHKEGDYKAAVEEFARWNRAGGRVLQGLVRRRTAEAALYRSGS